MTLFELVKLALDELYAEGAAIYGSSLDDEIKQRMSYLSKSYSELNSASRNPIDYRDPATRFAYVYKYTAAHGDYLLQSLRSAAAACGGAVFKDEASRVSCIGGGPGSDIIGVMKYLSDGTEPVKKLTCYLVDGEQAWADTWTEIGDALSSSVSANVNFQPLDVTQPATWQSQKKFLQADLFTLIYFSSEVMMLDSGVVTDFWKLLFDNAKIGAKFIYVDNGHDDFNQYFDYQWKNRGDMKCLHKADNLRMIPRFSEQADTLSFYQSKFGQSPKIQAYLSVRALEKV